MPARQRPVTAGDTEPAVHLLPLPPASGDGREADTARALCGTRLSRAEIEMVAPGQGLWCLGCFVSHVTGSPPIPDNTGGECLVAGLAYRALGWPVRLRRDQIALNLTLDVDAVALVLPVELAGEVAEILHRRRCPPPGSGAPAMPLHRIIVAGERFGVPLGWPTGVQRVTGTLLLPPTLTAHGPVVWVRPPQPRALRLCREIDVRAAVRTALGDPPPPP
jgi:hypothetical protein